ncbi:uncharacterized protein K444DRAFT_668161 [Hyaloscypha bicolor E]|uniref:Zn(2)-C6 fungal-type domain-containing protein n=1 Tax=Hyaloscypha bicolor E TaxID=1095630 RepID=A0A2J6SRD8_9HELO|nr:uncharacterized protein K444DRAFT_668161 [Hyaloscypha bicolor E]PMD53348.1 hypothetical protein K444DRAFT_668161 [Hyaloscypha bicolor E]
MAPHLDEDLLFLKRSTFSHSIGQRSYQACTPCRNRKLKCLTPDQGFDCPRCRKEGRDCVWAVARTKRGCEKIARKEVFRPSENKERSSGREAVHNSPERSSVALQLPRQKSQVIPVLLEAPSNDDLDTMELSIFGVCLAPDVTNEHVAETAGFDASGRIGEIDARDGGIQSNSLLFDRWHESFEGVLELSFNVREDLCVGDYFPTPESSGHSSSSTNILETRRRVLKGCSMQPSNPNWPSTVDNRNHFLWEGIAIIMKHIQILLFSSEQHTSKLIRNGTYLAEAKKFQPRLRGWKRDFDKLDVFLSARYIFLTEFEYSKVYLNSIALQAMMRSPNYNSSSSQTAQNEIETLINSCRNLVQTVTDGVLQGESLIYAPTRTYLRLLGATTMMLNALKVSTKLGDVAINFKCIEQAILVLRICETNEMQPSVRLSEKLSILLETPWGSLDENSTMVDPDGNMRVQEVWQCGIEQVTNSIEENGTLS